MSRLIWTGLATASTSASKPIDSESLRIREYNWHVFVSGTFDAATVQIQYSADIPDVADGSSTWIAPSPTLTFTSGGDKFFQAKPRKFRVVVTGGDGSTSLNVEIR